MPKTVLAVICCSLLISGCIQHGARSLQPQRMTGTETGIAVFQNHCSVCHGNPDGPENAADPDVIRQMPPERIYTALTTGVMQVQAASLSDGEKQRLAEFMSGRPLGIEELGDAAQMTHHCDANPPLNDPAAGPAWNGWGAGVQNARFQPAVRARLSAEQVPALKLRWAFGFPNGVSAYSQPTIASGRVFVGSDIGYVYSLDAGTGCIHWSFKAQSQVRSAITVGPASNPYEAIHHLFFGDATGNVYALDARTGALVWRTRVDDHFTARVTGSPTLFEEQLFVPVSSSEAFAGGTPDYPCCTFRGSVVALDAETGKQLWKTYTLDTAPAPYKKNEKGVQLYAPAGVSVWSTPTVDARRRALYFGTGDAWTEPAAATSDAVMALDIRTGAVRWVFQGTADDVWLGGCYGETKSAACPTQQGPDNDFGASPILHTLPNGQRVLIAAQKTRNVFVLDPDNLGALLWRTEIGPNPRSGVFWGGTVADKYVYYGISDGGVAALDLENGREQWFNPLVPEGAGVSFTAAVTGIPGVVFAGGNDGILRALSMADGSIIWEYNTDREFQTVNGVPAKGGSLRAPGPVIADGMLFVGSGYGVLGSADKTGNVLLAFAVE